MPSHEPWSLAPPEPSLQEDEVHIWSAPLDVDDDRLTELSACLSEDERRRAERFRAGELRDHYVVGRGTLRHLLAKYLNAEPFAFDFEYLAHGKPVLAAPWRASGIEFNLSHSHGMVLYAVGRESRLGIDVEQVRPMDNAAKLVERFFSTEEIHQWTRLAEADRALGFFHGWTRKEAWLKAMGSGLSFPLSDFSVSLVPGGEVRMLSIQGDSDAAADWWLDSSFPCPGYVAALAVYGRPRVIQHWKYGG